MNQISISDVTMKKTGRTEDFTLSFKEKIDLARVLDRLNVSVIETNPIEHPQIDSLLLKSLSTAVQHSTIAVPVTFRKESVAETVAALKKRYPTAYRCRYRSAPFRWNTSAIKSPTGFWKPSVKS